MTQRGHRMRALDARRLGGWPPWAAVLVLALSAGGSGCRRSAPAAVAQPGTVAAGGAVPEPPAQQVQDGLLDELAREAAHRPSDTPSVDGLLHALEVAQLPVARRQQVLATPLGAHYCAVASTADGLGLSLCEFDNAAAARAGQLRSERAMRPGPTRRLFLSGNTLVTLIIASESPQLVAVRDRAERAIRALPAR